MDVPCRVRRDSRVCRAQRAGAAERRAPSASRADCGAVCRARAAACWEVGRDGGGYNRASGIFGSGAPCVAFLTSGTANNSSNNSLGSGPRRANRTTDSVV